MTRCDYCRRFIIPTDGEIDDYDKVWDKEYNRRFELELSKRKGIKRFLYNTFCFVEMPFYEDNGFDFCSEECYGAWKEKVGAIFAEGEENE